MGASTFGFALGCSGWPKGNFGSVVQTSRCVSMIRRSDAEDARLAAASPARKLLRFVVMSSTPELPAGYCILLQFFITDVKAQSRSGWRIKTAVIYLQVRRDDIVPEPAEARLHICREHAVRQSTE